jgi:hypothetical protein
MKISAKSIFCAFIALAAVNLPAQDKAVMPSFTTTGTFLGVTPPLRDLPAITEDDFRRMEMEALQKVRNPGLRTRSYPFSETALPKGPDPVWQKETGNPSATRGTIHNFQGQTSPYYPPDCNGAAGPGHYMQTVNTTYAIYSKTGTLLAGPTNLNTLFNGVPGSNCNDGDPIVLYDEQADRWFVGEFSLCGGNDYMLMAVSTTNDPTGTWYAYSFDVADVPDYMKFGVWQDGYYMGTNTGNGSDIYVFERSVMLAGGANPQGVGFDNPWRPTTIDGFMCVPPLDNDGNFAPAGSPGLFITISDDAIAGGSDQLWIYELDVNWASPASSTFNRVQQINVAPFDSNFGTNWDNIAQPNTTRELDAIPMVIMNVPQYRNFGSYQTIVCCHTVDVDNTDHAGIRWYELRNSGSAWSVRQQGTFAPDACSRWMGSIALNGVNEIALGYSYSSYANFPSVRYCGQSSVAFAEGLGVMDIAEENIQTGSGSQTNTNRWGDYAGICVDPANDSVFWFTTQYLNSAGSRLTRIASLEVPLPSGIWTGAVSTSWAAGANWLDGQAPTDQVDVTIPSSAQHWPVFTGNLTVGASCGNVLMKGASRLTVTGNLTIDAGKTLAVDSTGTITIGGNWNNQGTFLYGTGTVEFNGGSPALLTGKSTATMNILQYSRSAFDAGVVLLETANTGPSGNDGAVNVLLPFTFYLAGNSYTTIRMCVNGWISLNAGGGTAFDNSLMFSTSAPNTTLAPWFDNLQDDNTSVVRYRADGLAPNRVFTVEWYRVRAYEVNQYARITFQAKLYETSNIIEFCYGDVESGTHSTLEGASIGIEDATGGANHFIEATGGYVTTGVVKLRSDTNWPAVNYRFTPPSFTEEFYNLNISKSSAGVTVNNNVDVHGSMNINPGAQISIPGNQVVNVLGQE